MIWSGFSFTAGSHTHGIHVCDYRGEPHLCFWEGRQTKTLGRGRGIILDSSYRVVATVSGGSTALDFHEFRLIENGTVALASRYKPAPYDLSQTNQNMSTQLGWIYDCGFQEIEISTGNVLFDWLALDHINPSETFTPLGINGEGQTVYEPWDYFHINSVEKLRGGDYIISARHTSTIYKISGRNGSILWRLGGKMSDFTMNFPMGFQHDVRLREETENETTTVLSLFNNQWDGRSLPLSNTSSGMIVSLNHVERTADMIQEYRAPDDIRADSQGSLQTIRNSQNLLINWGSKPWITEYLDNGTLVLNASMGHGVTPMYRASKAPWVGKPTEIPMLSSYARNATSPTVCHISWNGATEVIAWRFYASDTAERGAASKPLGQQNRTGFETMYMYSAYLPYVFAEAIDSDGMSLANSSITQTFVPKPELAEHCSELGCPDEVTKHSLVARPSPTRPVRHLKAYRLGNMGSSSFLLTERIFAYIGFLCILWKLFKTTRQRKGYYTS